MKNLLKSNQRFFVPAKGRWLPAIVLVAAIIFAGCKKTADIPCNNGSLEKGKNKPIEVKRGGSIQAAVDAAQPGDIIYIEAGIYKEAIVVNKADIQLIGLVCNSSEKVIIQNPGDEENGITVRDNGDGFVLKNVT